MKTKMQCGVSIDYFYPSSSTIDAGQSTTLLWQVQVPRELLGARASVRES